MDKDKTRSDTTVRDACAETVEIDTDDRLPVGGIAPAGVWQNMLENNPRSWKAILVADRLAARRVSVTPPNERKSIQIDISRIELIFAALNQHCDLTADDSDEEKKENFEKRERVLIDAINTASVFELIQIGKFLMENQHLCSSSNRLTQVVQIIFERLASFKAIEEISDEVDLRVSKLGW